MKKWAIGFLFVGALAIAAGETQFPKGIILQDQTATTVPYLNASKKLVSSGVTPTQLGYLDATSSVQTQINTKAPLASPTFTGTVTLPVLVGSDTTDSNSSTSGAFKTAGGVGVAKKLYVGTDANIAGALTLGGLLGNAITTDGTIATFARTGATNNSRLIVSATEATKEVGLNATGTNSGNFFSFKTDGTERATLNSTGASLVGSLGVGTTLAVTGASTLTGAVKVGGTGDIGAAGTSRLVVSNATGTNTRGIGFVSHDGTKSPHAWITHSTAADQSSQTVTFNSSYLTGSTFATWAFAANNPVTIASTLGVTGLATLTEGAQINGGSFAAGKVYSNSSSGLVLGAKTGSVNDFQLYSPAGSPVMRVPTGTTSVEAQGAFGVIGNTTMGGTLGVTGAITASSNISIPTGYLIVGNVAASQGYLLRGVNDGFMTVTGGTGDNSGRINFYGSTHATKPSNVVILNGTNTAATFDASGNTALGQNLAVTGTATFNGNTVIKTKTPASATATGVAGEIAWDASYIYICVSANSWKRVAIAAW